MNDLLTKLLAFLEELMANPEAAAAFRADPQGTLVAAGLANVTQTDIRAVMPVVVDYAPVNNASVGARVYDTSANVAFAPTTVAPVSVSSPISTGGPIAATPAPVSHGSSGGGSAHEDDHVSRSSGHGGSSHDSGHDSGHGAPAAGDWDQDAVIKQISSIVNNYSYTSFVDDRDTVTDMSTNQTIWTNGDVTQFFNNDAMVASGDHAVVAGGPVMQDNSTDVSTTTITDSYKVDKSINDSFNKWEQDNHTESNGNTWQQDNSDNSTNDSYNTETETETEIEVTIDDSGNTDNSKSFDDSFNDTNNSDNSTNIDDSFRVDDSFTVDDSGNTTNTDNSDNSTNVDDSFQIDDSGNSDSSTNVEDSGNTEVEVKDFLNDNTLSSSSDTYSADVHDNAIAVDDAAAAVINDVDHQMAPGA